MQNLEEKIDLSIILHDRDAKHYQALLDDENCPKSQERDLKKKRDEAVYCLKVLRALKDE